MKLKRFNWREDRFDSYFGHLCRIKKFYGRLLKRSKRVVSKTIRSFNRRRGSNPLSSIPLNYLLNKRKEIVCHIFQNQKQKNLIKKIKLILVHT